MSINVYFVRHGETYFNRFARLQGWSDTPLTEKGKEDARHYGFRYYSRPLRYLLVKKLPVN